MNLRLRHRGFTFMESLVLIGILIVLLSIFVPYLSSLREANRRLLCASHLRQLRDALTAYANENGHEFPRVRFDPALNDGRYNTFTGAMDANPFAANSTVAPNDVTASLWLLVRGNYVTDLSLFVCPSGSATRDLLTDDHGTPTTVAHRGNFSGPNALSYSYASPFSIVFKYRLNSDFVAADFALLADQNPGVPAAKVKFNGSVVELADGNSPNHFRVGQNVVYGDSHVEFQKSPFCGVGYKDAPPGDNIYTARAPRPSTQPTTIPSSVSGTVDRFAAPTSWDDSFLVPTTDDVADAYVPASTRPASQP